MEGAAAQSVAPTGDTCSPAAVGEVGRPADHIAWEQAVKHAAANEEHKPDYRYDYRCRYPGCNRVFKLPGALHTHTGWHKRKENISEGVYERVGHHTKEMHSVIDAQGKVTVLAVYRCDWPGCSKIFRTRGALHTHQGWHKRRPKEGQRFASQENSGRIMQHGPTTTVINESPTKRTHYKEFVGTPALQATGESSKRQRTNTTAAGGAWRSRENVVCQTEADSDAAATLGLLANIASGPVGATGVNGPAPSTGSI